ncbi:MAG: bifunctional (p)ppGpp synthetase/guanosine-3',5'-bis(diphosphate) 3'-pyrophosphohydrolase [Gammaproteobacteria bacterium]|nr:bifunctional (p)ppGpp synthetase/guanosine-3',5'-bis(diphosphate) 3'-pyrophosphohydrolase [Gammaproteobacteria bacterium]MBU1653459.1 bifunctional (p)ppGpp synthetase/guanosine-3',5'-bis(diphosphate) 3'-pyrophosphohydrolase [Gammaproteobacteria bacterium]MBU1961248.1 bifunctional (p)ppGpp synthetase/guanosine-3',5'-bis(diphosphate) 3'-pyrophosphohydrolase [Gammaproteobacteria bacterium]
MVTVTCRLPDPSGLDAVAIRDWLARLEGERKGLALPMLRKACDLAIVVSPQDIHLALSVADILHELEMDDETLAAALVHIAPIPIDRDRAAVEFSPVVSTMLADLARVGILAEVRADPHREVAGSGEDLRDGGAKAAHGAVAEARAASAEEHLENLRRMLLTIADDVRVVVIILAERLHQLRQLKRADEEIQRRIALETREIHAPLANRLGIWRVKWELEDFTLRYLQPEDYKRIATQLDGRRAEREEYIGQFIGLIREKCNEAGIKAEIVGRPKHIYSIWRKMQRKQVDLDRIFDLLAVRVLVDTIADCYTVLGFVHGLWRFIPGEFDDYIATPKANLYRSLHTAVIGPEDKPVEIQIRTHEMHEHSERGVAAHWAYKENRGHDAEFQRRLLLMRHWLELKEDATDSDFAERFKSEFEPVQAYVFTPQGKLVELPHCATPVDFAYAIHSDLGHRCRGAKVNGRIVPLTFPLESGVTVEILTTKEGGPSRDWLSPHLGYLKTSRARNRVRQWFKQQDYQQHLATGRTALDREFHRLGLGRRDLEELAKRFNFKKSEDLLVAIGCGDISPVQVANSLGKPPKAEGPVLRLRQATKRKNGKARDAVVLEGVGDLMYNMARCCKPVPYDPIIGFITRGKGVTVHRSDCPVIQSLQKSDRERMIRAAWNDISDGGLYPVDILVVAGDRRGLLRDISSVFTNEEVDVLGVSSQTNKRKDTADFRFTIEIADMRQLSRILDKVAQLPDVLEVRRRV